ncbi:MAG: hypothetical protein ABTQ32_08705 [Myxococcaceae bacterium]
MSGRIPLSRGWSLWPLALVRGAGFPVGLMEAVSAPALWDSAVGVLEGTVQPASFVQAWADARPALRSTVRALASHPQLREAVTWQNRSAVEFGLDSLVRAPADRDDAKLRKKESMLVSYLQRYATKCDTIGFFGPLGWARWSGADAISQRPGPSLLAARKVLFEPWAIAAVVDAIAAEFLPDVPLRLTGHARVALLPARTVARRIGAALSSPRTPKQLARSLKLSLDETLTSVRELIAAGLVDVAVDVPIAHHPEAAARRTKKLSPPLRFRIESALDALEEARAAIASAPRERLSAAIANAETTFTAHALTEAKRHEGRTYAGRSILYEETRRDTTVTLGEPLRRKLDAPVTVMLELARLYTSLIEVSLSRSMRREFQRAKTKSVPLVDFWLATAKHFEADPPAAVCAAKASIQALVMKSLGPFDASAREVRWSASALSTAVRKKIEKASPGWPGARHHAPDVMLAKRGDDFIPVLGELHTGVTPFTTLSVLSLTPHREELEALSRDDLPGPLVTPIPWEDFSRSTHDTRLAADDQRWHVDLGFRFSSPLPERRVRRAADLSVRLGRRGLEVVGKGFRMPLAAVMERRIKLRAANEFHVVPWTTHRPRIWLDDVVIAREAWRVDRSHLDAWSKDDASLRFLEVARTARTLGWPRWIFAKSPLETKPIYVDLTSPALVELLCKQAREAPTLVVSEMLPAPHECWLEDAEGQRFVAELRLLAVDPKQWG